MMSLQESFVTNSLLCLYLRQDHTAAFRRRQVPAEQEMVERQSQHFRTGGSPERNEAMQKVGDRTTCQTPESAPRHGRPVISQNATREESGAKPGSKRSSSS